MDLKLAQTHGQGAMNCVILLIAPSGFVLLEEPSKLDASMYMTHECEKIRTACVMHL